MATLAFGLIGAAVGSTGVFSGIAGMIGMTSMGFGWTLGQWVGGMIGGSGGGGGSHTEGPKLSDLKVTNSAYGVGIPILYGTMRMAGNIIESTDKVEHSKTTSSGGGGGGKGMGGGGGGESTYTSYTYTISFGVAFCEGPIKGIRKLWFNNKLVFDGSGTTVEAIQASVLKADGVTIYLGSETQEPDPVFESIRGVGNVPAYRGIAYMVVHNLQLEEWGNAIPNIEAEVVSDGAGSEGIRVLNITTVQIPESLRSGLRTNTGANMTGYQNKVKFVDIGNISITPTSRSNDYLNYTNKPNFNLEFSTNNGVASLAGTSFVDRSYDVMDKYTYDTGMLVYAGSIMTGDPLYTSTQIYVRGFNSGGNTKMAIGSEFGQALVVNSNTTDPAVVYGDITPSLIENGASGEFIVGYLGSSTYDAVYILTSPVYLGSPTKYYKLETNLFDVYVSESGSFSADLVVYSGFQTNKVFISADSQNKFLDGFLTADQYYAMNHWIGMVDRNKIWLCLANSYIGGTSGNYPSSSVYPSGRIVYLEKSGNSFIQKYSSQTGLNTSGVNVQGHALEYRFSGSIWYSTNLSCYAKDNIFTLVSHDTQSGSYSSRVNITYLTALPSMSSNQVPLSNVVADLCGRSGLSVFEYDTSQLTDMVDGIVVSRPTSARSVINNLQMSYFFDGLETDGKVKFVKRGQSSIIDIPNDDLAVYDATSNTDSLPDIVQVTRIQEMELPKEVSVTYLSKNASYQEGTQYDRRLNSPSVNVNNSQLPMSLTDEHAKSIASVGLFSAWQERIQFKFSTSRKYAHIDPTDVVNLSKDGITFTARITKRTDNSDGTISWEAVREDANVYTQNGIAGATTAGAQTVKYPVPMYPVAFECPPLNDLQTGKPYFYVAAAAGNESGGNGLVYISKDGGTSYTESATLNGQSGTGIAVNALGAPNNFFLPDETNYLDIQIQSWIDLSSLSYGEFLDKRNAIYVGGEVIQFREAVATGSGAWRLTGLLRGLLGTEDKASTHVAGELAVLLDQKTLKYINVNNSDLNTQHSIAAVPYGGSISSARKVNFTPTGQSLLPIKPCGLNAVRDSDGSWNFKWFRRARRQSEWNSGADVPLDESTENYKIYIYTDSTWSTVKSVYTSTTNNFKYSLSLQNADIGGSSLNGYNNIYMGVSQVGSNGESPILRGSYSGSYFLPVTEVYKGVSLLNFNGTNGSTTFTDEYGKTWTPTNATISTAQSKFGGSSGYFNGSGYIATTTDAALNFGSNDLTIEYFFYTGSGTQYATHFVKKNNAFQPGEFAILQNTTAGLGNIQIWNASYNQAAPFLTSSVSGLNNNAWHHLAVTRSGSDWKLFIDGLTVATATWSGSIATTSQNTLIGYDTSQTSRGFVGYIEDFHIINGTAKYTSDFIPPTAQLPKYSTGLHFDGTNGSTTFTDVTGKVWTPTNTTISTVQYKFGGASGYFNGSGYISTPNSSDFTLGTNDYTIEAFVYIAGNSAADFDGTRYTSIANTWSTSISGWQFSIQGNTTTTGTGIAFDTWANGTSNATLCRATTTITQNTWHHIAVTNQNGVRRLFLDGVLLTATTTTIGSGYLSADSFTNGLRVGGTTVTNYQGKLNGYIDDLRIIKGQAIYTQDFSPPNSTWK